ncbi:MAG: PhoH family protein [Bacteroidaceae bacterium]|nr:PhoH family protein [Prevotellaceae bacterium]MDY5631086.1 PhoH family protein [Bacteroidaceae bacterium]
MIEKHIILDNVDPVMFYGAKNANMQIVKSLFPKLRIVARGQILKVMGDEESAEDFSLQMEKLRHHLLKYNSLTEEEVLQLLRGEQTARINATDVLVYSVTGRPIQARSKNQQKLIDSFNRHDMLFAVGPAGSGKTYLSIALAVNALKNKQVRKIILSRPAVEAGEKLGFLPGDMKEKIDPYLQPLYDALEDMIPSQKLQEMMEQKVIQIAPLAFMRGRTLNDAIVILDEAQNTTTAQIKMFLTRMGANTKMIITGDTSQIDLPAQTRSGLIDAMDILNNVKGIGFVHMGKEDIVRHKLVTRIVEAYDHRDKTTLKTNLKTNE